MPASEIILHGTELSGHTHRVELLLRMLKACLTAMWRLRLRCAARRSSTG